MNEYDGSDEPTIYLAKELASEIESYTLVDNVGPFPYLRIDVEYDEKNDAVFYTVETWRVDDPEEEAQIDEHNALSIEDKETTWSQLEQVLASEIKNKVQEVPLRVGETIYRENELGPEAFPEPPEAYEKEEESI